MYLDSSSFLFLMRWTNFKNDKMGRVMEVGRWRPDVEHIQWRIQKLRFTNWSAKDTSVAHWSKRNHSPGQSYMLRRIQKYSFSWWCPKCTEDGKLMGSFGRVYSFLRGVSEYGSDYSRARQQKVYPQERTGLWDAFQPAARGRDIALA